MGITPCIGHTFLAEGVDSKFNQNQKVMKTIEFKIPEGMERETALFYDCCQFWRRMGVQKEDNIIAFSLADLIIVCKKDFMLDEWNEYYKEVFHKCHEEAIKPIYNENRGQNNFLINSGL